MSPKAASSSKKRKRESRGTHTPIHSKKEYSSDGLSFNDEDDDDLPDINLSPNNLCAEKFKKDDVVWAPYEDIYWPALVTSVNKTKVRFLWINEMRGRDRVYSKKPNDLISFDNQTTNQSLKLSGEKKYRDLREAYELVVKYFIVKSQNADISAQRYLTHTSEKGIGIHKENLYRMGRVLSDDSNYVSSEEDYSSENDIDFEHEETSKEPDEIVKELNELPEIEDEVLKSLEKEGHEILRIIKSDECLDYVRGVRIGDVVSERHKLYPNPELKSISGLGPFSNNTSLTSQLLDAVDKIYDSLDINDLSYKFQVLLPEAIIYGLMKSKNISKEEASTNFMELSAIVGRDS